MVAMKTIPILPVAVEALPSEDTAGRIHARSVRGRFNRWRWAMIALTQMVFYGVPWLSWNDRQAVLFDLEARRFFLFNLVLYPQDFVYLAVLLVLCALGLFLVTAVAGRVWCGFSCPQTVYTALFTWVERRFEGERSARIRLDAAPWSWNKLWRKSGTQTTWVVLALWTGLTFVGYFTPIDTLMALVMRWETGPWEAFWIGFYALATYANAGYLRENVCKHMCPYGRFQSVMFDRDTLIIGYDTARGEPRGAKPKDRAQPTLRQGDCIDCTLCVQVCPTGIDIRQGLQSNCIGCAACIDACDAVMDKINLPRGLVRYSSQNGLEHGWDMKTVARRLRRPRVLVYATLLGAVGVALVWSLWQRTPLRVDVIRDRGVLARTVEQGAVENLYRLHLMNAQERGQKYRITVLGPQGVVLPLLQGAEISLLAMEERSVGLAVRLPAELARTLAGQTVPIEFQVQTVAGAATAHGVREKSTLLVPR